MPLLHNKMQARQHILAACDRHLTSAPHIDEEPTKAGHMIIHHTTISVVVAAGSMDSLMNALRVISDQSDDVNRQAHMVSKGEGDNWLIEIHVGRPKPNEE